MYNLPAPTIKSHKSYEAAIATIRDEPKRLLFQQAAPSVKSLCEIFNQLAVGLQLNNARSNDFDVSGLDSLAMAELYDVQFMRGVRTKSIRDSIKNSAPNGLCPYCGEGTVAELDHYLPKTRFAGTTVHPANLIPACKDCNYAKRAYEPSPGKPSILHPYFDTAFDFRWLHATVEQGEMGPVINFLVKLDQIDPQLEDRLRAHMHVLDLWRRFRLKAAQSLDNFQILLRSENGRDWTVEQAQQYLRYFARQQQGMRTNSWEGATHEAMSASDWYLIEYLGLK